MNFLWCPNMHVGIHLSLLLAVVLLKVQRGAAVQEIQSSHDNIVKINSAADMMQCSSAMDILFLMDGSYSMGKGSFERSKHFAVKLSQALDIGPDKGRGHPDRLGSEVHPEERFSRRPQLLQRPPHRHPAVGWAVSGQRGADGITAQRDRHGLVRRRPALPEVGRTPRSRQRANGEPRFLCRAFPGCRERPVHHADVLVCLQRHACRLESSSSVKVSLIIKHRLLILILFCDSPGCQVESFPCERKTLETQKKLQGNFMCWKGSKGYSPYTSLCPYYSYNRVYKKHQTVCHRTICPDPCDSQPCLNGGSCVSEGPDGFHCVCLPGYGGDPHCAPALSLDCSVDLLFLLEGSSSLTLEGFLRFKSFLKRFLQTVIGSDSPSKVGLAVFGRETRVEVQVGKFKRNLGGFLKAVDALQSPGGQTLTGQALRHVTRHGFVSGVTDNLPRVVVLLTATPAADEVIEAAKYARDREIFLIGVGPDFLKAQLNNITGNPQRTLTYSTPDRLNEKLPELKAKICSVDTQGCLGQAVDLVFALDASASVGRENFAVLRDFVRSITVQFDINRDLAQVALVTYSRKASTVFRLDAHETGSVILKAVDDASYTGGAGSSGAALLHVYSNVLTVANGARPAVNKAVVLLTDGSGGEDGVVPAQRIRDSGVSVFVVGVGDVQRERLVRIAGSEDHMISVPSYEELKYFEDVLVQMLCADVKKPVNLCKPNPCMNGGSCILSGGSFRCRCQDYEGPHCERRSSSSPSRGDRPRPAGLRRKSRQKKSHQELLHRYKLHRRRHAA
uniref:von Willebrand factor A domain containing 2 n=1 Tax=Oryzias melastigma TaxID=30732 RepID=A0A3B3CX14_ORYME